MFYTFYDSWLLANRRSRARFHYTLVYEDVYVVDLDDGAVSVTNDAEAVCRDMAEAASVPGQGFAGRIYYRDTERNWDELLHANGTFKDYARITAEEQAWHVIEGIDALLDGK